MDRIRRLSWKVEFAMVLGLAFGWTLPSTLRSLVAPFVVGRSPTAVISDGALWGTILFELIAFSLLVPFLRARGWTLARLGIRPSLRGCLHCCMLAFAAYVLYVGFAELVVGLWPAVARALVERRIVSEGLSWTTVIVASVINPFYEEIFVCGYVISALSGARVGAAVVLSRAPVEGRLESLGIEAANTHPLAVQAVSLAVAVNVSAAIRLSYHLYQGVAGVLAIVPLALLFGIWFARTRQLWPLIVAHAILDFIALAARVG